MKKLNTTEKKLKFHCSTCRTVYQLLENRLEPNNETKCLNNCAKKWQALLVNYCQDQLMLDLARKEQAKEREVPDWESLMETKKSK